MYILKYCHRLSRFNSGKPLCSAMNFKIRSFSASSLVQGQYSGSNKRSTSRFFGCLFFFSCLAFNNIWFHRRLLILRIDIFRYKHENANTEMIINPFLLWLYYLNPYMYIMWLTFSVPTFQMRDIFFRCSCLWQLIIII